MYQLIWLNPLSVRIAILHCVFTWQPLIGYGFHAQPSDQEF